MIKRLIKDLRVVARDKRYSQEAREAAKRDADAYESILSREGWGLSRPEEWPVRQAQARAERDRRALLCVLCLGVAWWAWGGAGHGLRGVADSIGALAVMIGAGSVFALFASWTAVRHLRRIAESGEEVPLGVWNPFTFLVLLVLVFFLVALAYEVVGWFR